MTDSNSFSNSQNLSLELKLDKALQLSLEDLTQFTNSPDFKAKMQVAFGEDFLVGADDFQQGWTMPQIEIRDSAEIGGANGAYAGATNTIYISREFLASSSVDVASGVLLEELGHAIDWQWQNTDAPGDEGAIFSALVRGESLDEGRLSRLRVEDDSATIVLDGQAVEIEKSELDINQLINGLDNFLGDLQNAIDSQIWAGQLPLIGDSIQDSKDKAANFLEDIRKSLKTELQKISDATPENIQKAINTGLGELAAYVNVRENGDDLELDLTLNQAGNANSFKTSLENNIGLPGLGLNIDGEARADLGYNLSLNLGINKATGGFYVDTSADNEIQLNLGVTTPNLKASGELGFLEVLVKDNPANPTQLIANFTIDLEDADGKLKQNEFKNLSKRINTELDGYANINFQAESNFQEQVVLPSFNTDINIDWQLGDAEFSAANIADLGDIPTVAFNNVKMQLGSFFQDLAGPIFSQIQEVTKPVKEVADVINEPIPGLSDFKYIRDRLDRNKDGQVSLRDIVEVIEPDAELGFLDAIYEVSDLVETVDKLSNNAGNIAVELGSLYINDADIRSDLLSEVGIDDNFSSIDLKSQLESQGASQKTIKFINSLEDSPAGKLDFPILNEPMEGFKLLLGQPANLFTYDMPELKFGFELSQFYPIIGPLGVRLRGNLDADVDLAFGFDTEGAQQFLKSNDASDIFNGFFISDFQIDEDGAVVDVPELSTEAGVGASASINLLVAEAGIEGAIRADVDFDLNDPNNDGKLRLNEITSLVKDDPFNLFETSGKITAGLYAYYETLFTSREEFGLGEIELANFNRTDTSRFFLAKDLGGGLLRLNMGPNARDRQTYNTEDGNENFTISHEGGKANRETVKVAAFVGRKVHEKVDKIFADAGKGDDTIDIKPEVAADAELLGNVGDDKLYYRGSGKATLKGGVGKDYLLGGSGSDRLSGEDGEDYLRGGEGNDTLDGGDDDDLLKGEAGNDQLLGGAGDDNLDGGIGADTLDGGEGNDGVSYLSSEKAVKVNLAGQKSSGGDANGDVLKSIENLTGSLLSDTLQGGKNDEIINGADGNDLINGAAGNDTLVASWGEDTIDGGKGTDLLVVDYSALPTRAVAWRDEDKNSNLDVFIGNAYGVGTPVVIDLGEEGNYSYDVQLSADGTTVVYNANDIYDTSTNEGGLWVKKVDSSEPAIKIGGSEGHTGYPSISADGSKVAYWMSDGWDGDIFVVNSDGTGKPIKIDSGSVSDPSISGDGKKVAWSGVVKYDDPNMGELTDDEIFVANSDGTEIQQITNTSSSHRTNGIGDRLHASDRHPSLSADGSKVAWQSSVGSSPAPPNWYNTIFFGNTDGTNTQTISRLTQEDARQPLLSADGSKVAWNSTDFSTTFWHIDGSLGGSFNEVRVGNTDGSEVVGIPATLNNGQMTSFSPDGEALAIVQNLNSDDGSYGLFVANADGSGDATLIDKATKHSGGGSWNYSSSIGNGPSLSSYVDIGVRYRSFNPKTGSGEIATWGPSWVHFKNVEQFNLTGTIYDDELYGANKNDTLIGAGGDDTLKAAKGDDLYQLDPSNAGGSFIEDTGGNDTLELIKTTVKNDKVKNQTVKLKIGDLERLGGDLLIDLNSDGKIEDSDDLTIGNFFASTGNKKGKGFIETVANLKGNQILKKLGKLDGNQTLTDDDKKNKLVDGGGKDTLNGGKGNDTYEGVTKNGNKKNNTLKGANKDDLLNGKGGNDKLYGQNGDDTLIGGGGKDVLNGGNGDDTYQLNAKNAKGSQIIDTKGNDTLELDNANISLDGLAKGKTGFVAQGKNLVIDINKDGKANNGDLTIRNFFANNKANKPGKGFIETVDNVSGNQVIKALGKNKVQPRNNDIAEDTLIGARGEYGSEAKVEDAIADFIVGEADKIYLPGEQFPKLDPETDFAEQFAAVTSDKAAATSDAYIAYNSNNGNLFYNANGDKVGFGAGGQFAALDGAPELDANDFNLV